MTFLLPAPVSPPLLPPSCPFLFSSCPLLLFLFRVLLRFFLSLLLPCLFPCLFRSLFRFFLLLFRFVPLSNSSSFDLFPCRALFPTTPFRSLSFSLLSSVLFRAPLFSSILCRSLYFCVFLCPSPPVPRFLCLFPSCLSVASPHFLSPPLPLSFSLSFHFFPRFPVLGESSRRLGGGPGGRG